MKKLFAILLCIGLSGCYYTDGGYYDEVYTTPSTSYVYGDSAYAYPATTVIYEQPVVTHYRSHHYAPPRPRPQFHHNPPHRPEKHHGHVKKHGGHDDRPSGHVKKPNNHAAKSGGQVKKQNKKTLFGKKYS